MTAVAASFEDVHRFWFADSLGEPAAALARNRLWFGSSPALDAEIREHFGPTIAAAARGELAAWETAPQSCVALTIVLDQFPRNVHRGSADAFAHDALALGVTQRALAAGHFDALSVPERAFLLMPYQHVEDAAQQREGLWLFERMHAEAASEWREFTAGVVDFARRHVDILERFGRFPHRNRVLGRASTAAEREYLESKPETFGQG